MARLAVCHDQRTAAIPMWWRTRGVCRAVHRSRPRLRWHWSACAHRAGVTGERPCGRRTIASSTFLRRAMMRRRPPRQLPMPFDREVPAVVLPVDRPLLRSSAHL